MCSNEGNSQLWFRVTVAMLYDMTGSVLSSIIWQTILINSDDKKLHSPIMAFNLPLKADTVGY